MSALVKAQVNERSRPNGAAMRLAAVVAATVLVFLAAPGALGSKAHAFLHGLCAQRPSHTLFIGGEALPMDARMTGIYFGASITLVWLLASGRLRATRVPPMPILVTLAAFVFVMALDGFNALLADLHVGLMYPPSNAGRYLTGVLAGSAIGVALGWLVAITLWRRVDRQVATVQRPVDLVVPICSALLIGGIASTQLGIFFAPLVLGSMASAVIVVAALALVLIALANGRAWRCEGYADVAGMVARAWLLAIVLVVALAGMRFVLERSFGFPQLT